MCLARVECRPNPGFEVEQTPQGRLLPGKPVLHANRMLLLDQAYGKESNICSRAKIRLRITSAAPIVSASVPTIAVRWVFRVTVALGLLELSCEI